MHTADASALKNEANSVFKSVFVPVFKHVMVNGKPATINGGIKSLDPPCKGEALSYGDHHYTCDSCFRQLRHLKDTLRHRQYGSLEGRRNRIGSKGFNKRYAKRGEMLDALDVETQKAKLANKTVKQMVRRAMSQKEWEDSLHQSCLNGEDQKLAIDLVRLMKMGISKSKPIQVLVLRNLVSKLKKGNNHHYVDRVKDISSLFKNELGPTNYSLLAEIFGLARETTAANHCSQSKLYPGLNNDAIDSAAQVFKGLPVNEGSDGARCLRYLEPRKNSAGKLVLVGYAWNPDVDTWKEQEIEVPRKDTKKGDLDDFAALKRLIDSLISKEKLSKSASVHNLTALASLNKPTVINCMWPIQEEGYKHNHLLKYWESLHKACYYEQSGAIRKTPLNLIGYSTDSAGFSLSAAKHLMTPSNEEMKEGVQYLGLGIDEERFLAPYYWFLPSIAYLDYDHEQRLFLKNLKHTTRDLTFWQEDGKTIRLATIEHLKDLKHRCQVLGLDCGFNASDLLLIYFCDQNSDACERMFTPRVADLLDEHVPGSQATSLYIRAVYHLVHPYRVPDFGSPEDVQKSVSCGISILRLWKKVVEIKKMGMHAKPGAKSDPSKRGHFLTSGCYDTAEILFSAATIHQLAMFLHFKELGPRWASPYNSGTKSTERIIGEMQGKTNELQSLDSQPTFGDMLDKSAKVQFNLNAKSRLSGDGVNVKSTHKRKRLAFAFKKNEIRASSYPEIYSDFKDSQVKAHKQGVKNAQILFEKYMPPNCITLLKESNSWEKPFSYKMPDGCIVVNECPPKDFNKLETSFANVQKDVLSDSEDIDELEIPYLNTNEEEIRDDDQNTTLEVQRENEETCVKDGGRSKEWKLTKVVDGKTTYIHIRQAIKLLLPREYISRCRQKRHFAAKYLPGKEPLNPKHDVVKYCDVVLKVKRNNTIRYQIARIESIESATDGKEMLSFESKGKSSAVRVRCSLYATEESEIYFIPDDVVLTSWRSPSAIIGAVDLQPLPDSPGKFKLHPETKANLQNLGFLAMDECLSEESKDFPHIEKEDDIQSSTENNEGFYEVDEVIGRRISKDTLTYEYKVRFKGYGPEDDMWLPSSFFNRVIQFESISKFGRKRKHTLDPQNVQEPPKKKRMVKEAKSGIINKPTLSESSLNDVTTSEMKNKLSTGAKESKEKDKKAELKRKKTSKKRKKSNISRQDKGKAFRSTLRNYDCNDNYESGFVNHDSDESDVVICTPIQKRKMVITISESSSEEELDHTQTQQVEDKAQNPSKHELISILEGKSCQSPLSSVSLDILKGHGVFKSSRREISRYAVPVTNPELTRYSIVDDMLGKTINPLHLKEIPPLDILEKCEKELKKIIEKGQTGAVQFTNLGSFTIKSIRAMTQLHTVKEIQRDVLFEQEWLSAAFGKYPESERQKVEHALLDGILHGKPFQLMCYGCSITSHDLATLCGERYLPDEIINFMVHLYCERANEATKSHQFLALSPFLMQARLDTDAFKSLVKNSISNVSAKEIKLLFLPVHMDQHWGLAVFGVEDQTIRFDDGYHLPIPRQLKRRGKKILECIHSITGDIRFQPDRWKYQRFKDPMPDQDLGANQKYGNGSCGIEVIMCTRDFTTGSHFTWSYNDSMSLRAEVMIEILNFVTR